MGVFSIRADGSKIKAARDAKGWSQEKLASEAGYKLSVIQKLEQGTYFSSRCLECCAEALGVLVADLLLSSDSGLSEALAEDRSGKETTDGTAPSYTWIEADQVNDVLRVRIVRQPYSPTGIIEGAIGINELEQELFSVIEKYRCYKKVVISLAGITYWASITFVPLLKVFRHLRDHNRRLKLCDANPLVLELFRCHRIDRVLEIVDNREAALYDWR